MSLAVLTRFHVRGPGVDQRLRARTAYRALCDALGVADPPGKTVKPDHRTAGRVSYTLEDGRTYHVDKVST